MTCSFKVYVLFYSTVFAIVSFYCGSDCIMLDDAFTASSLRNFSNHMYRAESITPHCSIRLFLQTVVTPIHNNFINRKLMFG